jgi:glyoxylase-like metal-dependent hydrolase (beta-lactamase superfamily II)
MLPVPGRRDVLRALLAGSAGLALGSSVPAAAQQHAHAPTTTRLTDTLFLISGAGGNVVLALGPDSAALVNGGHAEHAETLLATIKELAGGRAVRHLFNTDWHSDHTGLNETLGRAGAEIIAHEQTKQYLGAPMFLDWQARTYKPLHRSGHPTKTFYAPGAMTMTLGAERVEYGYLGQAHTDGDIYVFFKDANVLVAGDVLTVGTYPIADYVSGGWLGGMMTATKTLHDLANDQTRVVPGTGPVQTRADLKTQHEMLVTLRDRVAKMMRQGMGTDDMRAAGVTKEWDARLGDPALFLSTTYRGMWLHVRELGGIV